MKNNKPIDWYKLLSTKTIQKIIVDEETGDNCRMKVRTNISRIVKRKHFGRKETYIRVESVIYCNDKINSSFMELKI